MGTDFFAGIPVDVDLVMISAVLCAAGVDSDDCVQILLKAGFPFIEADNVTAVIVVVRYFSPGVIVAHFRIKIGIAETAGIAVGTNADVKRRVVLESQKSAEAVAGNVDFVYFYIRIEADQTVRGCIDREFQIVDRFQINNNSLNRLN